MRKSKLVLSILSLVFYVVAVIGLFCPFIWQIVPAVDPDGNLFIGGGSNNGLESGLNVGAFPQNLPNLLVVVFVAIGFLASLIYFIIVLAKSAKPVKKKKTVVEEMKVKKFSGSRYLFSMIVFGILCGFVPFLCASLTLVAYGISGQMEFYGGVWAGYFIGEGAALSGIGALLGGMCLYFPTSGLLD